MVLHADLLQKLKDKGGSSMNHRPSKADHYLNIALEVSKRGTCIRRNYGCIIVKGDEIIATGYTGAPRGQHHCTEDACPRALLGVKTGERYELCRSVHAEQNAIISAARKDMLGEDLYVIGTDRASGSTLAVWPCLICRKLILNAGIERVYIVGQHCMPRFDWKI
jgi:dCMP deaminase